MDIKELTNWLVKSSESSNQQEFIPWWEDDFENATYYYDMISPDAAEDAKACAAECGREELLSPVGRAGLTLFHLLVWHNFYDSVEKALLDGRVSGEDVDITDHKGHGLTPFLLACARGNLAMAKLLLAHGAKDSLSDDRGMNAYHFLAYARFQDGMPGINFTCLEHSVKQRGEIARLLTCDINQKNAAGLTPLEQLLSTESCGSYTWPLAEIFLDKGADTGYVDENGNTLLMLARRNGHRTAALALMERCPEMVNTPNKQGVTPMAHAVSFGSQAMYLALKDHGAEPVPEMELFPVSQITSNLFCDVNDDDMDGLSIALYMTKKLIREIDPDDDDELGEITNILHNALVSDEEAHVLDACGEAGIDFTAPIHYQGELLCLRDQCLSYGMGAVRKMMELGVDMDKAVIRGRTPANILASMDRRRDSREKELCEEPAKLFSKESMELLDNGGEAAVHRAAKNGHLGMLEIMIEKGVDVNLTEDAPGEAGITPLHLACRNGYGDAAALLMNSGADDTMKTVKGETPAHLAVKGREYGEKLKTEQKAEVLKTLQHLDIPNEEGQTPLLLLGYEARELLPIFLDRGVDVNHADNEGRTALMLYTDKDAAKELLRAGADIHMADREGNTALHYALKEGDQSAARFLIKKGADYNRANNHGDTPAQIAAEEGYETVLELMTDIK